MVCEYLHIFNFVILGHSKSSVATGVRRQLRGPLAHSPLATVSVTSCSMGVIAPGNPMLKFLKPSGNIPAHQSIEV